MKKYVILIAIAASMGGLLSGYDMGVMSGALLFIKDNWLLSPSKQGFLVSSAIIGCIIGAILNGKLSDIIGRKKIILLTGIIFLTGSILSALSINYYYLVISRIIIGCAVGAVSFAVPLYLSEISPKKFRGTFVSLFQLALTFGILFAYFINVIFSSVIYNWRFMLGFGIIPSLILIFSIIPLGDSPRFLLSKGKIEEADIILERLGQKREDILDIAKIPFKFEKWVFIPLFLGLLIMFVQICTGINIIIYYAPTIFEFAGFVSRQSAIFATIGIGIVNFLMTLPAIFLSDKIGRKPLVYIGLSVMAFSLTLIALSFNGLFANPKIIVFLAMLLYICAFSTSLGPVTYILTSELFPLKVRGFLMSIAFSANFIFNFVVVFLFLPTINKIGAFYTFLIFAFICVLSLIFYIFFIPETKGVSLEDIEKKFKNMI